MNKMLMEIENVSKLLETNSSDEMLKPVKESYSIFYMCENDHPDYINGNNKAIDNHLEVVIDFYKRFVRRIRLMMDNNPQVSILSIMGP